MLVDAGFAMLSISAPVMGRTEVVHPVLVWDEQDVILVDTGYPGQFEQLKAAIEACEVDFQRLNRVVMTHQDIDHIGNLQLVAERAENPVEVSAHPLEKPYIQGERRLLRFTDEAMARIDALPESVPESFRSGLKAIMLHPPKAAVAREIIEGDRLPWGGGLRVIETPGHTPGHLSLFHERTRTLIAGDALLIREGGGFGVDKAMALDPVAAAESVLKLSRLEVRSVICYHGGHCSDRVQDRLRELARELQNGNW